MVFPALDALREGYDVNPVVDALGGTSPEAHRAAIERTLQAGGKPTGWVSLPASYSATGRAPRRSRSFGRSCSTSAC
jgi:Isochorismatase family